MAVWMVVLGILMFCESGRLDAKTYPRRDAVVEAFERVSPAVVNINLEYEVRKRLTPFDEFRNPLFEEFFKDFFDPGFNRQTKRNSLGSGVIIDGRRGLILTTAHVVAKSGKVNIVLSSWAQIRPPTLRSCASNRKTVYPLSGWATAAIL